MTDYNGSGSRVLAVPSPPVLTQVPAPVAVVPDQISLDALTAMVVSGFASKHTRRIYAGRLREFIESGHPLTREGVSIWLTRQRDQKLMRPPAVNQCLSAVKKLADEAEIRGLLSRQESLAIRHIKCTPIRGTRSGNWLTLAGAQQLMEAPDRRYVTGKRDACLIALLLGCGLRRSEACDLTWGNYAEREGRMCLVDITGKGERTRTVPVPDFARRDISAWRHEMERRGWSGRNDIMLHRVRHLKGHTEIMPGPLTPNGLWHIIAAYAERLGMANLAPHDLRRTLARLMRKAGAPWEQIQFSLGHESIVTTQLYVGSLELDEGAAGVDMVKWERQPAAQEIS